MRKFGMKLIAIIIVLVTMMSFQSHNELGPLVATIVNGSAKIELTKEHIQTSLDELLSPSKTDFTVKNMSIVEHGGKTFLRLVGSKNEKCMIPLHEMGGKLYEMSSEKISIVVCFGCSEGCEPQLLSGDWICSGECDGCTKSVSVTDEFLFS